MCEEKTMTILERNQDVLCKRIAKDNEEILFLRQVRDAVNAQKRVGKTHMGFWEKIAKSVGGYAYKTSYTYWPVDVNKRIEPELFTNVSNNTLTYGVHQDYYNVPFADVADELLKQIDGKIESVEAEQKALTFRLYHLNEFFTRYNAIVDELNELYAWYKYDDKAPSVMISDKWGGEKRLDNLSKFD